MSAVRWSTSVPVMTWPLTMAVAVRTDGSRSPKISGLAGMLSASVVLLPSSPTVCATAAAAKADPASINAALPKVPSFIIPPVNAGRLCAAMLLNPSLAGYPASRTLAAQILERHTEQEGVAAQEGPGDRKSVVEGRGAAVRVNLGG